MAGGTGGHIFPGLAVAQALLERGWSVQWLGNPNAMEGQLVPPRGLTLNPLVFSGLRGKGIKALLLMPLRLLRAFAQAIGVLRRVRPDVVLGMGGYVAFPGGMMASLLGIPLVVHEQNSIAGLTNRMLAKLADRSLVAFPGALSNAAWVGNPVRKELLLTAEPQQRYDARQGAIRLLVVGGSLGAMALNDTVPAALALCARPDAFRVTHQSGKAHIAALQANYSKAGVAADCIAFIDDMSAALADADLVICRAGAMTVAEVACVGVAALFVPFPFAVDDHQTTNAAFLAEGGAAMLIAQRALTAQVLAQRLQSLSREELKQMAVATRALAKPRATIDVVEHMEAVVRT
jgi:UDP-N-acetylglucosamine--N-acetylmuramyl-(pentapeptide) pyrophosphoryl-undecaprenol N-acetylglucosamine transferase